MLNLGGNKAADYDTYLRLLHATAQRKDAHGRQLANPKNRVSQHLFTYDYVDHGSSMFMDAWDANDEDFFDDNYEETLHLIQNQGIQTRPDRSSTNRPVPGRSDGRPTTDRPHIPKELWDQLDIDAKLWYCGKSKQEIAQYKNTSSRKAQQMLTTAFSPDDQHIRHSISSIYHLLLLSRIS